MFIALVGLLISRILLEIVVLVECGLWQRQEIGVGVKLLLLLDATTVSVVDAVEVFLYLAVAAEVEPPFAFEGKLQTAFLEYGLYHCLLAAGLAGSHILQLGTLANLVHQVGAFAEVALLGLCLRLHQDDVCQSNPILVAIA